MIKKLITVALAITLLMTAGCANVNVNINTKNNENVEEESATGGGKPWIDSDLKENLSEDMPVDPRDDFHLYANEEWLLNNDIPIGYSTWSHYNERGLEVKKQCMELLKDESLTGHDAELIQTLNSLILDWDTRNASGVTEIRDLYDKIIAVKEIKEVSKLLTDKETALELFEFVPVGVVIGLNDPDKFIGSVGTPGLLLNDAAEYPERSEYGNMYYGYRKDMFVYIAGKLGMDKNEAEKRFDSAIDLETRLAERIYTTKERNSEDYFDKINNEMSFEDAVSLTKNYPLEDILTNLGLKYDGPYFVFRPDYFELLDEVYSDDNIEEIRNLILVHYLLGYERTLDKETYDKANELSNTYFGTNGSIPDEEMAYNSVSGSLPVSMQKVYISKYGSEEEKKKMEDLCYQVIETYRELLSENTWASDEVKEYAIKKLDSIGVHAAYPDKLRDTSKIDISDCSLIEAYAKISEMEFDYDVSLLGTERDDDMWGEEMNILSCNAFYNSSDNTINMLIGMMGEPFYSDKMSTEELYASIGAFWVGHEISHAFDSKGSQFDAEGKYRDWWTKEDKEEFRKRVNKMDDYLNGIIAFDDKHFIGSAIDTEMVADMTGLQCALRMASKVDGFDYDKFFTKYAQMNGCLTVYSSELSTLTQDVHPLEYSRTNVPVQQFEEFYETYNVKEGDNMYLAPEDRLLVW